MKFELKNQTIEVEVSLYNPATRGNYHEPPSGADIECDFKLLVGNVEIELTDEQKDKIYQAAYEEIETRCNEYYYDR